nr:hypothetical protein [uncultured archaeon]
MEIGDTVCNVNDYSKPEEIKGFVLRIYSNRVLLLKNGTNLLETYSKYFALSRIVLLEKYKDDIDFI